MLIRDWREREQLSLAAAALRLGAKNARTVLNWEEGICIPRRDQMRRIFRETGGAVTANDFYGLAAELAA